MSDTRNSHAVALPPDSESTAVRLAAARGQAVSEYLSALVIETLARRAAEEPPPPDADHLSFWEQAMDSRRSAPPD